MRAAALVLVLLLPGCIEATDPSPTNSTDDIAYPPFPVPARLEWKRLADANVPRAEHCATNVEGKFYVLGGFVLPNDQSAPGEAGAVPTGPPVNIVEIYDATTDSWTSGPAYPTVLEHCLAATIDDTIYIVYNVIGTGQDSCNKLKAGTTTWVPIACPPNSHNSGAMELIDGKLYAAGGSTPVDVYDPATDSWETMEAEMPTDRGHTAGAAVGGKLYMVAGDIGGHSVNTDANEAYDPKKDNWTILTPIPVKRGSIHAVAWYDRVVVMGGQDGRTNVDAYNNVNAYEPITDTWTELPAMTGRHGFAAAVWEDRIYVFAGAPQQGVSAFAQTHMLEALPVE